MRKTLPADLLNYWMPFWFGFTPYLASDWFSVLQLTCRAAILLRKLSNYRDVCSQLIVSRVYQILYIFVLPLALCVSFLYKISMWQVLGLRSVQKTKKCYTQHTLSFYTSLKSSREIHFFYLQPIWVAQHNTIFYYVPLQSFSWPIFMKASIPANSRG